MTPRARAGDVRRRDAAAVETNRDDGVVEIVGSFDAIQWVPEANVVPPGLDLREFTPVPPSDSPRPLVVHAPSSREKKGTRYVIEACEQLPVELDIVEGVPHEEARARYARADIVVDQLNAGWHGVFALESMALGKPVVTYLKPEVVNRSAAGFGAGPSRSAFLSAFFSLVGCHGLHVSAGVLWLLTMMAQVFAKGFRADIQRRFLCFALFWHALDIIWVAVFSVVYLLGSAP